MKQLIFNIRWKLYKIGYTISYILTAILLTIAFNIQSINAQVPNIIDINLIDSVDISQILYPQGNGVYRPDVVAINNTLFLTYGTKPQFQFHLIKLNTDANLTPVISTPIVLFSGNHDKAIDIRISKDSSSFWYAFEDFDSIGGIANSHFLNSAWYSINGILIDSVTSIATGVITVIPQAFSIDSADVPPNPEAVDDPTPFFHNNAYYILTRAWSGFIDAFTPNTNHHIRVFNENKIMIDSFILNLSPVIPDRTLSQNTLIDINGQVFLIGGFCIAENDMPDGSYIYAIPLTNDLKNIIGTPIPLIETIDQWAFKVTTARVFNNLLFINYQKYFNNRSIQNIAVFDINNNYSLIRTIEISNCPIGSGGIFANHTTFEIANNFLFVFYPETNDRIFAKVFEMTSLEVQNTVCKNGLFNIYPNPSNGNFTFEIKDGNSQIENRVIEIYNLFGEKVFQSKIINAKSEININVANGLYFYQVKDNEQFILSGKLIVK